ncbi:hypothetical protein [Hymenobacter profundi]|uniref:Response regulatory domain-containing protein n=1 Tax=Hymenobacter profundi TaxID=1982110 RepID=A0ABS6WZ44_9BACT|nr:hypothetical protein [Hymenobacter profundi]MBW3128865.1 hypothetical protein [Hymenobacter profundi]
MLTKIKPELVIIDDNITEAYPLVDRLKMIYDADNIHIFPTTKEGIEYIENNISKRIIVLLDIMFGSIAEGLNVFDAITEKSLLICFIIMTGSINNISKEDLVKLINRHAWYIVQRDKPAQYILDIIKKADAHISSRVDSALEEWVLRHSREEQIRPFIKSRNGESYSLLDILDSVRKGGDDNIGQEMISNILAVAIDILARDKSRIGNK